MVRVLDRGQVEEFAERGFLLLRQVIPPEAVRAAARAIDKLVEGEPPGTDVRGPFNYFRVKRAGHDPRWREFLQDPWLDYDPIG